MRTVITGQIGMDKKPYLQQTANLAGERGGNIDVFNVGSMMYDEGPDIRAGRILDLPLSRLHSLRRAAIKDIVSATSPIEDHPNVVMNTHATFRWRHGLFPAFDFDQMDDFNPNLFICLVDNIEVVHHRLHAEHDIDATLKDCMVWREEEILATELMAQACGCRNSFYVLSRGRHQDTTETCYRLIARNNLKKNAIRYKKNYDAHVCKFLFVAGDKVWYFWPVRARKLDSGWIGPFEVLEPLPNNVYCIKNVASGQEKIIHVDNLRSYLDDPNLFSSTEVPVNTENVPICDNTDAANFNSNNDFAELQLSGEGTPEPDSTSTRNSPSRIRKRPAYLKDYDCT